MGRHIKGTRTRFTVLAALMLLLALIGASIIPNVSLAQVTNPLPPGTYRIIDNGDPGFSTTGTWFAYTESRAEFQMDLHYANFVPSGPPNATASWAFTGLTQGNYQVAATWAVYPWNATNTPFAVFDNGAQIGPTLRVNQQAAPTSFTDAEQPWHNLGTFTINSGTLRVTMSNDSNSWPNADAIRIIREGSVGRILDNGGPGFSTIGPWVSYSEGNAFGEFQGDLHYPNPPGPAGTVVYYEFAGVPAGQYHVAASWIGYSWAATNTPFEVWDNNTLLTPTAILVNQQVTPTDFTDAGKSWRHLGNFTSSGGSFWVGIRADANSWTNADAARIELINGGPPPTGPSEPDAVRFLEQASWGPTPGLVTQVRTLGFDAWLNQQFTAPSSASTYSPFFQFMLNNNQDAAISSGGCGPPVTNVTGQPSTWDDDRCRRDRTVFPLQRQAYLNSLYAEDQLRQRMAWALHKIIVVSGQDINRSDWFSPYIYLMYQNAFGNYRDLLYQITLNPAMGNYLDIHASNVANPNENFAREILQLFSVGLWELDSNGNYVLNGGDLIPAFTEEQVQAFARVFTGLRRRPRNPDPATGDWPNSTNYRDPMWFQTADNVTFQPPTPPIENDPGQNAGNGTTTGHDFVTPRPTLLNGFTLPARSVSVANAYADLNDAIDNIYNDSNVGPYICKQLIQQLATSNPSPAYVGRVVAVFDANRASPNQLREVVRAILLDTEARGDVKTAAEYGHLKEPVLFINNILRAFDVKSADRAENSDGVLNGFNNAQGQNLWAPASVFSYYSPFTGLPSGPAPLVGPEFGSLNTTTVLARANFVNTCVAPNNGRVIDVVQAVSNPNNSRHDFPLGTSIDVSPYEAFAGNAGNLVDELSRLLMHNAMSAEMRAEIVTAVNAVASSNLRKRVRTAVYLICSSSQYQVQR